MAVGCRTVVYDFAAGPRFLLFKIFPESVYIRASIGRPGRHLLDSLQEQCQFFYHINLTRSYDFMPDEEEFVSQLSSRQISVFNSGPRDISKRTLQAACSRVGLETTLASRYGNPDELVIVKTDLNFGGRNELILFSAQQSQSRLPSTTAMLSRLRTLSTRPNGAHDIYPVLQRRQLDDQIWSEVQLIPERFVENSRDIFYRVHFLRDHISVIEAKCHGDIKKLPQCSSWMHYGFIGSTSVCAPAIPNHFPTGIPTAVMALRRELRLSYGAFDIMLDDDGAFYFVDVNSTPFWGSDGPHPLISHLRTAVTGIPES